MSKGTPNPIRQQWLESLRQLWQQRSYRWSLCILGFLVFLALFCRIIANDKPLYCVYQEKSYFPVFQDIGARWGLSKWPANLQNRRWHDLQLEDDIWPLIPYAPTTTDIYNNSFTGPFDEQEVRSWQFRHWLGTDELGRDVLAALIWGSRIALLIGLISMFVATLIGVLLGSTAGFYGDHGLMVRRNQLVGGIIGLLFGLFYGFVARSYVLQTKGGLGQWLLSVSLLAMAIYAGSFLLAAVWRGNSGQQRVSLPVDSLVMRLIEILTSIPGLMLLLTIVGLVTKPSILTIMAIIGLLRWPSIARFVRGEMLRIRSLEYIDAARTLGFSQWHILRHHALPNALGPVIIAVAFGIAATIILESALSFLGIGLTDSDTITWGALLRKVRSSPSGWWLAIFPGLAIFVTVTIFNLLGDGLSQLRRR